MLFYHKNKIIDNKKLIKTFEEEIWDLVEISNTIIVLMKVPFDRSQSYNKSHNVYALNKEGDILWQIDPKNKANDSSYTWINKRGDKLFVNDFSCFRYEVDLKSGEFIGKPQFTK